MPREPHPESFTIRLPYGGRSRIQRAARAAGKTPARWTREALLSAAAAALAPAPARYRRRAHGPENRPRGPGMD